MPPDPRVHVGVVGILWDDQGRLCMLKRGGSDSTHGGGLWAMPGGWVDFAEDPKDTIVREFEEEVGLTVDLPNFAGYCANTHDEGDGWHIVCLFFTVRFKHGLLHNMEPTKHEEARWVPRDEIWQFDRRKMLFGATSDWMNRRITK